MKPIEMKPLEILERLESGDISVNKAISLLHKHKKNFIKKSKKRIFPRKAHWLKIRVRDDGRNLRLYFPISLFSMGFSIGKLAIGSKYVPEVDGVNTAKTFFNNIDRRDMKKLVKAIKKSGKVNLVQVIDGNTLVDIGIV